MKNRIVAMAILLIVVFLGGFLPQYVRARRLEGALRQARQEHSLAELQDLATLAYIQASQKNYGLAADTSVRFFNRVRELMNQMPAPERKRLEDLLTWRDKIGAELAKSDPGLVIDLQSLLLKTREVTTAGR